MVTQLPISLNLLAESSRLISIAIIQGERSEPWVVERIQVVHCLIDLDMAGPIKLKLGGMVEGMQENVLAKKFFGSIEGGQGQNGGPQVPLLGHGNDIKIPN